MEKKKSTKKEKNVVINNDLTEIVCIVDKSGSMYDVVDETIGSFDSFIEEQKQVKGEANITLALFDNNYQLIHNGEPLDNVKSLRETYRIGGSTALNDSIGKTIINIENRIKTLKADKVPSKFIVMILTDGQENASSEFTTDDIKKMIGKKKSEGWDFVFLGADEAAFAQSRNYGIAAAQSVVFSKGKMGSKSRGANVMAKMSSYYANTRSGANYMTLGQMDELNDTDMEKLVDDVKEDTKDTKDTKDNS